MWTANSIFLLLVIEATCHQMIELIVVALTVLTNLLKRIFL